MDQKVINEFKNKNYQYIHDNIDTIVNSINDDSVTNQDESNDIEDKVKVYEYIFESYFNLEKFDILIQMYNDLLKVKIESYPLCMYTLLACVGLKDVYLAISYIRRSKLLKENLKWYLDEDGSNYYNFLKENVDIQMLLIVVTCINKLECNLDESFEYSAGVSYYELISLLFEIGYSKEVIKRLTEIGYILFK